MIEIPSGVLRAKVEAQRPWQQSSDAIQ